MKTSHWLIPLALYLAGSLAIVSAIIRLSGMSELMLTGASSDEHDAHYVKHLMVTLLHLIPGCVFLILGPLQFIAGIRNRWPVFHRWSGRIFIVSGFIMAMSAMVMNLTFPPVGGLFKSLAVFAMSIGQILTLIIALRAILLRQVQQHKAWMIRAFAVGLSVSTMRVFFIPYFIIAGMPSDFVIGLGMWIGLVVNVLVAELIVYRMQRKSLPQGTMKS